MRWLVDECVSAQLVGKLREAGHDVVYIVEVAPGAKDREVADRARRDARILLTDDKDFGELVIRQKLAVPGLILMRIGSEDCREQWRHGATTRPLFRQQRAISGSICRARMTLAWWSGRRARRLQSACDRRMRRTPSPLDNIFRS